MILQGSRAYFSLLIENVKTWEGFSWTRAHGALINWAFTGQHWPGSWPGWLRTVPALSPQKILIYNPGTSHAVVTAVLSRGRMSDVPSRL